MNDFRKKKIKKRDRLKATGLGPKYMWDASSERVKFWMQNSIFPKNCNKESLYEAIQKAGKEDAFILNIGCGRYGQSLLDLEYLGCENLVGIDFNPPLEGTNNIEFVPVDLTQKLPIETAAVTGVIFGSYYFHYMSAKEQLGLLNEIDRISGKGSKGFLGPFFPQHLENTEFSKRFDKYKNPLYGFVSERNKLVNQKWVLHRSRIASHSVFSGKFSSAKTRKGLRIPVLSFYDMAFRAATGKLLGNAIVSKDYHVHVPNEFFITFTK